MQQFHIAYANLLLNKTQLYQSYNLISYIQYQDLNMPTFYKLFLIAILSCLSACKFDPELAKDLFYLNVATYCRRSTVQAWSCKPCSQSNIKLTQVKPFYNSTGNVLGVLAVSKVPQSLILIFRGTDPRGWKNWIQDFNFIETKFPLCDNNCHVHRGFYHAFLEVQAAIIKTVKEYRSKYQIQSLIIVGHSLGGALAQHAAVSLTNQGIYISQLYHYGSPRVGDSKFSTWFDSYIKTNDKHRVTHGHDPVPHLPPHSFGFNHVPHEVFQKGNIKDGYVLCNDSADREDPNCSDKFKVDVNVQDHGNYCGVNFLAIFDTCI